MSSGSSELMWAMMFGSAVLLGTLLAFWGAGVALFRRAERERRDDLAGDDYRSRHE